MMIFVAYIAIGALSGVLLQRIINRMADHVTEDNTPIKIVVEDRQP